jgi:hypothetical protein
MSDEFIAIPLPGSQFLNSLSLFPKFPSLLFNFLPTPLRPLLPTPTPSCLSSLHSQPPYPLSTLLTIFNAGLGTWNVTLENFIQYRLQMQKGKFRHSLTQESTLKV